MARIPEVINWLPLGGIAAIPAVLKAVKLGDWWLKHAPYPFWASCCGIWAPWCWIDDICHLWFPMTFGFSYSRDDVYVDHWPREEPWICRKHDRASDRYGEKKWG